MALSPQEQQELAELEELEALEAEEAAHSGPAGGRAPAVQPNIMDPNYREEGAQGGGFNPMALGRMALDAMGMDTSAAGRSAVNAGTLGYVGGGKQLEADMKRSPGSSIAGTLVGGAIPAAAAAPAIGAGIASNALAGGAQGALSNPGEGGSRTVNGLMGLILGAGGAAIGKLAAKGAKTDKMVGLVKDESKLYDAAKAKVSGAIDTINEKVVSPADQKIRELLRGKTATLDLDKYRGLAPQMIDDLEMASPKSFKAEPVPGTGTRHYISEPTAVPQPDMVVPAEAGGTFPREPVYQTVKKPNLNRIAGGPEFLEERVMVPGSDSVNVAPRPEQRIPQAPVMQPGTAQSEQVAPIMQQKFQGHDVDGEAVLNLRQALDKDAWKMAGAFDGDSVMKRQAQAEAANSLRPVLSGIAPETDELFEQSSNAMRLRDVLAKGEKDPIKLLQPGDATTKAAMLTKVDDLVGTDLRSFGQEIQGAQDLLPKYSNLAKPLAAPNELRKMAIRGAAKAGTAATKLPEGTNQALINVLLRGKQK